MESIAAVTKSGFDLTGRTALITGASQGIGFALAKGLGLAGATVVINARGADKLSAAGEQLTAAGISAHAAVFDVTDSVAVGHAVAEIEASAGPLDILVNNAGIQHRGPLEEFPADAFRHLMETNLYSAFYVGQAVAKRMIDRRRGAIINVCSVQSELARPSIAPYTASKGALKMLTKGMAAEWGKYGIRANGLAPGYFRTELNKALVDDPEFTRWLAKRTPLGRWGDVDELIGAAVFLASDASSFVTGHILYVDGGITSTL